MYSVANELDENFFDRADAHIHLANEHGETIERGKVSASLLYAAARYNSWVGACGFKSGSDMREAKQETMNYFVEQYKKMLEENLDDYIENFDRYMKKTN